MKFRLRIAAPDYVYDRTEPLGYAAVKLARAIFGPDIAMEDVCSEPLPGITLKPKGVVIDLRDTDLCPRILDKYFISSCEYTIHVYNNSLYKYLYLHTEPVLQKPIRFSVCLDTRAIIDKWINNEKI